MKMDLKQRFRYQIIIDSYGQHNYKIIRGHNRSSHVATFRFNFEMAKMRFKSIAGRIPKNIRDDTPEIDDVC